MKNSFTTEYDLPSEHFDFAIKAIEKRIEQEKEIEKKKLINFIEHRFTKRKWVFWGELVPPNKGFVDDVTRRVLNGDFSDFVSDSYFLHLELKGFFRRCQGSDAIPKFWLEMLEAIELAKGLELSKLTLCGKSALDAMNISVRYKKSINSEDAPFSTSGSSIVGGNHEN